MSGFTGQSAVRSKRSPRHYNAQCQPLLCHSSLIQRYSLLSPDFYLLPRAQQALSDPCCQSTCLCLRLCVRFSANLMLNISETKRFIGSRPIGKPIGKCLWRVDR